MSDDGKIRVLIADDSLVIRSLLTEVLKSDPKIDLVGKAVNGQMAIKMIEQLNPDIVTLDIEMPEMDGIEALKEIRKKHPKLPIIMFSTLTAPAAASTLEALSLGASDYVTKPSGSDSAEETKAKIKKNLLPKIHGLARIPSLPKRDAVLAGETALIRTRAPLPDKSRVEIVAIGVSTGGPNALAELIPRLPKDFAVPVLIVQHMPPMFTKLLAERLNAASVLTVVEAKSGEIAEKGKVYIAPGGLHMVIASVGGQYVIKTNEDPPLNSCRPSVDALLNSLAGLCGRGVLAVMLTGMGSDGLKGCEALVEAKGQVIAQDEASSVVWGMPGFVAKAGLAEKILPLPQISQEIIRRVAEKRVVSCP